MFSAITHAPLSRRAGRLPSAPTARLLDSSTSRLLDSNRRLHPGSVVTRDMAAGDQRAFFIECVDERDGLAGRDIDRVGLVAHLVHLVGTVRHFRLMLSLDRLIADYELVRQVAAVGNHEGDGLAIPDIDLIRAEAELVGRL